VLGLLKRCTQFFLRATNLFATRPLTFITNRTTNSMLRLSLRWVNPLDRTLTNPASKIYSQQLCPTTTIPVAIMVKSQICFDNTCHQGDNVVKSIKRFTKQDLIPPITTQQDACSDLVIIHLLRACDTVTVLTCLLGNTKNTSSRLCLFT